MRMIWDDLLNLFFPRLCVLCREPLTAGEEQICLQCLCDLPYTRFFYREENPVGSLFAGKAPVANATAFLHYEKGGKVQHLIHAFKYRGNRELACQLGRQAARALESHTAYQSVDFLIPVPLHPKRRKKRGYNQSEYLCRGIASVLHIPIHTTALQRRIKTGTQTRKSLYERWLNMQDVFVLEEAETLRGCHILLVDDVVTSGSTLSSCVETLGAVPGIRISILALAMA
ncbi:MAG: ComF family protein [Tannerellaceae bacterium]|jgi:ComF family protein|nr:ComF family protein [Tannerellaceae bacterium]